MTEKRAKKPERLPRVFSRSEVKQILAHLDGVEHLIGEGSLVEVLIPNLKTFVSVLS